MKKFYVHFNNEELGPLSIEELKNLKITRQTMSWYEGLEEWRPAGEITDLQSLFPPKLPPPLVKETIKPKQVEEKKEVVYQPLVQQSASPYQQPAKKSSGVGKFVLILLVAGGLFMSYIYVQEQNSRLEQNLSSNSLNGNTNSYEQNVMTVEEQEKDNPRRFLSANGTYRDNLLGNKTVLNGTITNTAAKATFKDVVIEVKFYSSTETLISSENYVIYDFFPPGSTKNFNMRIKHPGGTEKVNFDVVRAVGN